LKIADTTRRYWYTLRYLKPIQFYRRLWFRFCRPRLSTNTLPTLRVRSGPWQAPAERTQSLIEPDVFVFLRQSHRLPQQGGWNNPTLEKLWLYNLHYFDDLNAVGNAQRSHWHLILIKRWVNENLPTVGNGWEPYPTSLRMVNWVKWCAAGGDLPAPCMESLALQARWLMKRLEWHLQGNHLFANAKALVFAGLFFQGPESAAWLSTGLRIIRAQLPEQVLPDGGNFERSPMYHAIFMEDLLDLINAASAWPEFVPGELVVLWREAASRMLAWLTGMTHPDGQIGLFNDAAFGVAPDPLVLRSYAARLGVRPKSALSMEVRPIQYWPQSGYARLCKGPAVALLDLAPIGPDYLPGHAHADTLSFELSVGEQRLIVNGGTSRYGVGPERQQERGTAAHSTVEVAGQSSSEVWGGFRVARRAYPFALDIQKSDAALILACSHDGYTRLTGRPVHRRCWRMTAKGLAVEDSVTGGAHAAVARFILHPAVQIVVHSGSTLSLQRSGLPSILVRVVQGQLRLDAASYCPEFGLVMPTQCLSVSLINGQAMTQFQWS